MEITSGKVQSAIKTVIYGPEGIGKSSLAAQFPDPIFCDTEGSTKFIDVRRTPNPTSWAMILEQVKYFIANPHLLKTFVLDTADWAEMMCVTHVCAKADPPKNGIEDFGYGKGYTYLGEEFGRLLNLLTELLKKGVNVTVTAHAKPRRFDQPDEIGSYDRWEMKLSKTCAPLLKEWGDMVLFASYKTYVINVDGQGAEKGKNKAQGGKRIMRTTHAPTWDAKNRHGLPEEIPLDFAAIAHIFQDAPAAPAPPQAPTPALEPPQQPQAAAPPPSADTAHSLGTAANSSLAKLFDLMQMNQVLRGEIQQVVGMRGHFPTDTPLENYPEDYVQGVLIGAWDQVFACVEKNREELPF